MADPAEVSQICDELGISRPEALFYLEGFDWDFASAMEASRFKTLPPAKVKSSPAVLVTEQSTAAESSATPVTIKNPPCVLNQVPLTPPRTINPSRSSPSTPGIRMIGSRPPEEISSELKKERIDRFREVAGYGMPLQEVVTFLERFNWDITVAVDRYWDERTLPKNSDSYDADDDEDDDRPAIDQSYLQGMTENYIPMIGVSNLDKLSKDEVSTALAVETMMHRGPPLPSLHLPSLSQFNASLGSSSSSSSSSSSGLMNVDVPETGDLHNVPILPSSQVQGSSSPARIKEEDHPPPYKVDRICNETGVCRYEALYYLKGFDWDLASAMEACRSKTLPPLKGKPISAVPEWESPPPSGPGVINSRRISNQLRIQPEQLPPKNEELSSEPKAEIIKKFCDIVQAPPEVAVAYLNRCKWRVDDAINYFLEECYGNSNTQRIAEDDPSTMGQSESQSSSDDDDSTSGFSEDITSRALASERWPSVCPPAPLMGLPSQSKFQASGSSSSSLMNIDPTETEKSHKEVSDESVPVAIPPMASSEVDKKLKGKAVEEDSSTETFPDPLDIQERTSVGHQAAPTTITLNIYTGGSGIPVDIPFRSDQTVRDIRNAIDERTSDNHRDYYLLSMDGVECNDLNTPIGKICKGGLTTFHQIFI